MNQTVREMRVATLLAQALSVIALVFCATHAVAVQAEKTFEADAQTEGLRGIAGVERNVWAYDAVRGKLGFLRGNSVF